VTKPGVETVSVAQRTTVDTPQALAAVVENATELARAELRLGMAEARAWVVRMGFGLALLWLSLLLLQVFALLLALSPLLLKEHSFSAVGAALALALVPAVLAGAFAARELARAKK